MKKAMLVITLLAVCTARSFSQRSFFVSALGSDENSGLSESSALRTLEKALENVRTSSINRITVIGSFSLIDEIKTPSLPNELLITGLRNAQEQERAVFSGGNKDVPVLSVSGAETRIRLENMVILGHDSVGLLVMNGASVSLGPGTVIRNNQTGIKLTEGTCAIEDGEVRDNLAGGVLVTENSVLVMRGGVIRNNGRGVLVQKGGRFSMTAGSITANKNLTSGAGVYVQSGGRFDQTFGTIEGNTAPESPDIYREAGAFGNDIYMAFTRQPETYLPAAPEEPLKGIGFNIPFLIGVYTQSWRENYFSAGVILQIGLEIDFKKVFHVAVIAEADGGFGFPNLLEGNFLGVIEMYFSGKRFGLGGGYGIYGGTMHIDDIIANNRVTIEESQQSPFYRFELIFHLPAKAALFATYLARGDVTDFKNWGFGIQFGRSVFNRG
ncbi:MAG: right-handed parallel beta-helix repeat-containing protein [Treponema sp.]|jgi:hypothetical protein|nr:right-handed parallel beta-helix repeat-containing protein [Treponema sp.]